ncbi:MAG: tetratricopeptide repeat protein, partial [Planctomycetaceae bacterium]
ILQSRNKQALAAEGQKLAAALEVARTERQVAEREREQADQERARATDASVRAETERARAVEREALAVKAVDEFRMAVLSNPELASSPKLGPLRLNLLRKPLEFYRQLRDQLLALPEPSLDNLWKLRDASSQLAVLHTDVGDLTEAIKLHESVLDLCDRALQHPELVEPGLRLRWGTARVVAHLSIGTTLARTEDKSRELQAYERALAASETLLAEAPDDRRLNGFRASALSGAASVLASQKRWDEARQRFEQAAELHRANIARHPQDAEARRNLARSQTNFAGLLEGLGDSAAAAAARQEAESLFAGTGDKQSNSPESRHREAANQFNRGIQLARSGQLDQALKAYQEAATGWRRLGQDFPANNEYAKALRPVLMNISTLLERRQKSAECLAVLDELIGLLHTALEKSPESTEYKGQLVDALHMQGHHQFATGQEEEAQQSYTAGDSLARQMISQAGQDLRWTRHLVELSQHLAALDAEADELAKGRERLEAIAPTALSLVEGASVEPVDRILLRSVLGTLSEIQDNQGDQGAADETRRLSLTWDERDPAMQALDRRVQEVVTGAQPQSLAERISVAKRLATRDEPAAALRLCVAALESQPGQAADRQAELGYVAACVAVAEAARLPVDRAEEAAQLRGRALNWLQQELASWRQVDPTLSRTRRHALRRWRFDPYLASVSREDRRARLPEAEQAAWRELFREARQLATSGTSVQ